ncbi:MAG TPA: hypothetical protein VID47_01985 [Actinomycetota bacterium]|jgi:Tol biopolymer transport system component
MRFRHSPWVRTCTFASVVILSIVGLALPGRATPPGRNGRIAYVFNHPRYSKLLTARPDGSDIRRLVKIPDISSLDWSPDARRIVFCGLAVPPSAAPPRDHIFLVQSDGTGRRRLTRYAGHDCEPTWSPDGEWIAFDRRLASGATRILAIRPDGTGVHLLVPNAADPQYSPDGRWIAFTREIDQMQAVFVRRVGGGPVHRITPLHMRAVQPEWAPSGERIAVLAPYYPFGLSNVYTMDPDGSNRRQITHVRSAGFGILDASWSPDGRRMVLQLDNRVVLIRTGGGHMRVLGTGTADLRAPDWGSRP